MPQRRSGRCSNAYPGIAMSCVLMSRASTRAYFSRGPFRLALRTLQNHATRLHRLYERQKTAPAGAVRLDEYVSRWRRWCRAGLREQTVPLCGKPVLRISDHASR